MKKLMCMLLSLTMLFSISTSFSVFAEDEETVNSYITQLADLKIIEGDENGEFHADSVMTRAQFCTVVSRMTGAYSTIQNIENDLFTDIDNTYWGKDYILYCAKLGLVSGYGDNTFEPEAPIETYQAVKILVELLGYGYKGKVYGGYPTGYVQVAREIGILKGVDVTSEEATLNNLSRLIYNALKCDLSMKAGISGDQVIYEVYKGKNLLTEYLSMNVSEGIVDGCYAVSISGNTELYKNEITIDKIKYICNLNYNLNDFVGKKVTAFYKYDPETMNVPEILSIVCNDENEILTLDVCDIVSAANNVISVEGENGKDIDYKFGSSIKYIINYDYVLSYDIKKLPDIKNGKVELIDNNGDNSYDVLKVFEYETFIVENASEKSISGKLNDHSIDLTKEDTLLSIRNIEGEEISISKIKENTILFVAETDKVIDIIASNEVITGNISSIGNGELQVGSNFYEISEEYTVSSNFIGGAADLYLDPNGRVAFIIESLSSDMKTGYLISIKQPENEYKDGYIKLLTDNGDIESFKLADKINLGGTNVKLHSESDKIFTYLSDETKQALRNQVIRYQLNDEGKLFKLEVSSEYLGVDKDGFVKVTGDYIAGTKLEYYNGSFNGIVFPSNKATVFIVPSKDNLATSTEDDYAVITTEDIVNDKYYNIDAYYLSKEHMNADIVVLYDALSSMADISYNNQICVYMDKLASVNKDGEANTVIRIFDGTDILKLPLKKGFTAFDNIASGDIIRYALNSKGEISSGEVRYKVSTGDLTTLGTNYAASIRISGGYIASIRNNMIRVESIIDSETGSNILSLPAYPTSADKIIVVETENGKVYPKTGSSSDFAVGDYVIIQQRTGNVKTIVIFKQ